MHQRRDNVSLGVTGMSPAPGMSGAPAVGDNRLAVLAEDIRALDAKVRRSAEQLAVDAIEAGNRLIEAKEMVPHGSWESWLASNTGVSARSAQRYMRLARSGLKSDTVSLLGLRAALDGIARHSRKPDAEMQPEPDTDAGAAADYDLGIPITDVVFVRDLYPRSAFDLEVVRDYSKIIDELPPIEINQNNELIDGRYRLEAHKARGLRRIRVIVTETRDRGHHLTLACERNSTHGLPFSREARERLNDWLATHPRGDAK